MDPPQADRFNGTVTSGSFLLDDNLLKWFQFGLWPKEEDHGGRVCGQ